MRRAELAMNLDKRRSIRRGVAIVVGVGALGALTGCFGKKTDIEEQEPFTPRIYVEQTRLSAERLKSEDERNPKGGVMGPVDKTADAVWDQIVRIYYWISGDKPFDQAKNLVDPAFPDKRRQAIMFFSKHEYGRRDPYRKYYTEMARTDDHHVVRAMAIRAMNRARVREETAVYVLGLEHAHPMVRLEAAKALANMPDPAAVAGLIKHLEDADETNDVRVAAADALRLYKTSEAAQALVRVLRDREFGVAWQARQSLRLMTGKDFRFDPGGWLAYLTGTEKPFG
jgi:hypothetical protein